MSLYNADGQVNLTVVNGSFYTGLHAADGSWNVVINNSPSYQGLYHPCGALNAVVVTDPSSSYYDSNGSLNVVLNSSGGYSPVSPDGNTPQVIPSLISASVRLNIANGTSNAWIGQQVTANTNKTTYTRVNDQAVRAVNGIRGIYANIGVSASGTLPSFINNAAQEQGSGSTQIIRAQALTGLSGTDINQSGAIVTTWTFNDAVNGVTIKSGSKTIGMIWKLDMSTPTVPAFISRTYAQMVSDGGLISASTVNGTSLPNSQAQVPNGYVIIADKGPNLAAKTPYFIGFEQQSQVITVTSITDGSNTFTVNTASTGLIQTGNVGTVASATGNTTVNGTWQVASVVPNTSITFTAPGTTTGAVTGSPTLRFSYASHHYNGLVTANPLGDFQKAITSPLDVMGIGNWTSIGATSLVDGGFGPSFTAVIGTDPNGGENVLLHGDSIGYGVRDGAIDDPSSPFLGDSVGNIGFLARSFYPQNIPAIRVACPSETANAANLKGDDTFRQWLAGFCDVCVDEMGHNDVFTTATYSTFKATMIAHWDRYRAALRSAVPRVVTITLTPLTAQLLTDKWTTGRNSTYQTNGASTPAFTFPAGYVYNNYHVEIRNGTLIGSSAGKADGFIDIAHFTSNLDGSFNADDGFWPVDGVTNYKYTVDGTHPSKDAHIGISTQITRPVLVAAKVILA